VSRYRGCQGSDVETLLVQRKPQCRYDLGVYGIRRLDLLQKGPQDPFLDRSQLLLPGRLVVVSGVKRTCRTVECQMGQWGTCGGS
jgi:hypothetical protein